MIPQKINNHIVKDLIDSEGDEIQIFELKGILRKINEMKEDIHKHSVKSDRT
jgi:hypothetical protein